MISRFLFLLGMMGNGMLPLSVYCQSKEDRLVYRQEEPGRLIINAQNDQSDSINITALGSIVKWMDCHDYFYPGAFSKNGITIFRIEICNSTSKPFKRLLCFTDFLKVELMDNAGTIKMAGIYLPLKEWSYGLADHCVPLQVEEYRSKLFYLKCFSAGPFIKSESRIFLRSDQNEKSFQAGEIRSRLPDTLFLFFYLGFLFFCFIYFLMQFFFRLREKLVLVYSLYILFTFLYSFRDIDKHYFLKTAFPFFNGINNWGEALFSYSSYIFYSLFVIYLLKLNRPGKKLFRFMAATVTLIGLLLLADGILRWSGNEETAKRIFTFSRMVLYPLTILYLVIIISVKGTYYKFFLWGFIFLVLGMGLNLLVFLIRNEPGFIFHAAISSRYGFWGNTVNYTRLGVILEVLFFSVGLAKKMRMEFAEAAIREESAIETRFYTHEVKSALTVLRSKLGNEAAATNYLHVFRDYLSRALELMKHKTGIELTKEIEMASEYFKLRQEDNKQFGFSCIVKDGLKTDEIMIPAGLLIPFIQNFFDHAVVDPDQNNLFQLMLYKNGRNTYLNVTDNGKGIDGENVFNRSGSSGLDIARRKLNLFNSRLGTRLEFTIQNNKEQGGTLIIIKNLPKKKIYD
jgi:two-component sensor histidine kinase